jgi:DNA polymerase
VKKNQIKKLKKLKNKYKHCTNCDLSEIRSRIVFGKGLCEKGVMILGEAPGPIENKTGNPFMGRAGKQLDKLLSIGKLERNDCFIFNSSLCYPGRNESGGFNKPDDLQLIRCVSRLLQTIDIVKPRLIVLMGATALKALMGLEGVGKNRGPRWYYAGKEKIRVFVTYHPSGVMRNPEFKRKAIEDWERIGRHINGKPKKRKKRKKAKPKWPTKLC